MHPPQNNQEIPGDSGERERERLTVVDWLAVSARTRLHGLKLMENGDLLDVEGIAVRTRVAHERGGTGAGSWVHGGGVVWSVSQVCRSYPIYCSTSPCIKQDETGTTHLHLSKHSFSPLSSS